MTHQFASEAPHDWFHEFLRGATCYYISGLVVLLGCVFGRDIIWAPSHPNETPPDLASTCIRFDGIHYQGIVEHGYQYDVDTRSSVAFFPIYPLIIKTVVYLFDCDTKFALLIVSNFTVYGDTRKGRRPAFDAAAPAAEARVLYDYFVQKARLTGIPVETGSFQAHMLVELENDGPITLICESR